MMAHSSWNKNLAWCHVSESVINLTPDVSYQASNVHHRAGRPIWNGITEAVTEGLYERNKSSVTNDAT